MNKVKSDHFSQKKHSVQKYIDETPVWRDGTKVAFTPMTTMQWRIWTLATAGKFFEGLVVFMTGVALPLMVAEFGLSATQKGMIGAMPLLGILFGASAFGGLADMFGRKFVFIVEMALFVVFLLLLSLSPGFLWVAVFLFGMGAALGCDYPTAHMIISESIASRSRGKLVLSAFGFQAIGAICGTVLGYMILSINEQVSAWRYMYAAIIIPAILVMIGRFFITQSPHWLATKGRMKEAQHELKRLLKRTPHYPKEVHLKNPHKTDDGHDIKPPKTHYGVLFSSKKKRRTTILASVPWFLQDLSTYGIGIFTPTILADTMGHMTRHPHTVSALIHNDIIAAKGAAFLDGLLLVGIIGAILLADKIGRIRLQVAGFIGCALGLLIASFSLNMIGMPKIILLFSGFMLFNFMTNIGPNAMTYLLAGEVFPTHIRGKGAGFAASFAKIGAVATAFLFPILLKHIGAQHILYILVATSLFGALITWIFRIETTGVNLENI